MEIRLNKTSIASHRELEDEIISDLQPKKFNFDAFKAEDFVERVSDYVSEQKNVKISSQNCPELSSDLQ